MRITLPRLIILGLTLGLLAATPFCGAFAQDNTTPAVSAPGAQHHMPDPQKQAQHLARKLNLDADQQTKLAAILTDREQQVMTVRGDNSLPMPERKAKLRAIHQGSMNQIQALLTPAQQQQFEQMRQAMKARREARLHPDAASSSGK